MRPARLLAGVCLVATLALLAVGDTRSQDKDKKGDGPAKPMTKGQLPRHFDQLGLTDAQRAEVLKVTAEQQEKRAGLEEEGRKLAPDRKDERAKLREEIRKLDEEAARKRVTLLTDDQRKKLIDLVAGPPPKAKADPKAKDK